MTTPTTRHRPFGVSLLSLIILVSGVLQIGGGIVILVERNNADVIDALDTSSDNVTMLGILTIVFGVIALLVGLALRQGQRWARTLLGVLALANVAFLVVAAFSSHHVHWYNVAWPALFYSLLAGYLFSDEDAKAFFA